MTTVLQRARTPFILLALLGTPLAAQRGTPPTELTRWQAQAGRVTITRDDWGIPHIEGRSDADAVFGLIYAQAEDDFPRIEANYLTALGRTAEADGEDAIWADLRQRLFADPVELKAQYAASPAWLRTLMQAWADGLNYYLAMHLQVRPKVLTRFEPWMALSFTEGSIGGDIERISLSDLKTFYGRPTPPTPEERGTVPREPSGSNGIAIAPRLTANGHALLLINPHTSFYFRSEAQMTSAEGLNAYGASTWGQFFIYQGFNAKAGWMHTSSTVDNVDEFAERIAGRGDGFTYRYGKVSRAVTTNIVTVRWLNWCTSMPAMTRSRQISACMSQKPITRSGSTARMRSRFDEEKPLILVFSSRARAGRTVNPEMPAMTSSAPSAYSVSTASVDRQAMRW